MQNKMKVAVVGCGGIAHTHCSALAKNERTEIVGLCDIKPERAEEKQRLYAPQAKVFTDYMQMFDTLPFDALHICLPHYLHAPVAIEALRRSKHVFLEKPMCITEGQITEMLDAERASSGRICVCFQNRFNNTTLEARRLVALHGGAVCARGIVTWNRGGAYYTESGWRGSYATEGGGVMINQAIHTLDLLLGFLGIPRAVSATIANHHQKGIIEVEDTCECVINFDDDKIGCFYATNAYGTSAPIILELHCADKTDVMILGSKLLVNGENVPIPAMESENVGKTVWGSAHPVLIDAFYRALQEGGDMPVPLASAADAVRVLLAAYRSNGERVDIIR